MNSPIPKTLSYVQKMSPYLVHIFFSKYGCHGNAVASLKILIAYFYLQTPKPYYSQLKFLDFLHRTEINAILADVCLNSVVVVTLFDPLKIQIIYVNSLTPKTENFR